MAGFNTKDQDREILIRGCAQSQQGWTSVLAALLITLLMLCGATTRGRAETAEALLNKMIAAYQRLSSYEGRSNGEMFLSTRGQVLKSDASSAVMKCKRPNKFALILYNSRQTGTRSVYSDGNSLTVYDAVPNHYYTGATARTMASMLQLLSERANIGANLDPLYFMCQTKLPDLTELRNGGIGKVNGRASLIVKATLQSPETPLQKFNPEFARVMHWTWYIDATTFLLNKVEAVSDPVEMPVGNLKGGSKLSKATMPVVLTIRQSIVSFKINAIADESVFVFHPPIGATGQKFASPDSSAGRAKSGP